MVEVEYAKGGDIVVDTEKAMETPANVIPFGSAMEYGPVDANMESAARVVQGRFKMGSQYHFHMETHTCIVSPTEDGFDLLIPSQSVTKMTAVVAKALNIPVNR